MGFSRFLIVRLSAIGDVVFTLPLAAALKEAAPGAYVGWVVEEPSASFVVGNPAVDWCHVLPRGWLKSPRTVLKLRRALRAQRFDAALDVQGLSKSAIAGWMSRAPTRVGFVRSPQAREIAPFLDTVHVPVHDRHIVDISLSLIRGVGLTPPEKPTFPMPPAPAGEMERIAAAVGDETVTLLAPWASVAAKTWLLERYAELAVRLREATGMRSLILGYGERERSRAAILARAFPDALALAPELTPVGVAALAARAALCVGVDSFPIHAATAVGCPAVGLFGVTDPERVGPYFPPGRAVHAGLRLDRSIRELKHSGPEFLLDISVDMVFEACMATLRERPC